MAHWKYASMGQAPDSTAITLEARDENNVEVFRGQFMSMADAATALDRFEEFNTVLDKVTQFVHAKVTETYGEVTERDAVVMGLAAVETFKHFIRSGGAYAQ